MAQIKQLFYSTALISLKILLVLVMSFSYGVYLETLHENQLWFSNIKEVEREISFRTEQGLYYSFYKTLVNSDSFWTGLQSLSFDNTTEAGRVINSFERFNIFQEVVLALLHRLLFRNIIEASILYVKCVFILNAFGFSMLFISSYLLHDSWLAGLLTVTWFLSNKTDSTRVYFTVPLRESFALPFLFFQTTVIIGFVKYHQKLQSHKLFLCLLYISTFLFTLTWQFAQFVLILQCVSVFAISVVGFMQITDTFKVLCTFFLAVISVCFLQFGQKMLLGSFVVSFIPASWIVLFVSKVIKKGNPFKFTYIVFQIISTVALTLLINAFVKSFLTVDEDEHVMSFLLAKLTGREPKDFVTKLYACNEGFTSLGWDVIARLSANYLFQFYCSSFLFVSILCLAYLFRNDAQSRRFLKTCRSTAETNPHWIYLLLVNLQLGVMSLMAMRMKFIWVPFMCILAPLSLTKATQLTDDFCTKKFRSPKFLFYSVVFCLLALLTRQLYSTVSDEMNNLMEFWDPDTVELMEWIANATPVHSVFAGSMQLLAGVKLCTNRAITNHPHFENKWLRDRTLQVYQVYAKRSPEEVHRILTQVGASYVILEDSICLSPPKSGCSLPEILEMHSLHRAVRDSEGVALKYRANLPLFCLEVRNMKPSYAKLFKLSFSNGTFKVYQVLQPR